MTEGIGSMLEESWRIPLGKLFTSRDEVYAAIGAFASEKKISRKIKLFPTQISQNFSFTDRRTSVGWI